MPGTPILVYDLGLSNGSKIFSPSCNGSSLLCDPKLSASSTIYLYVCFLISDIMKPSFSKLAAIPNIWLMLYGTGGGVV